MLAMLVSVQRPIGACRAFLPSRSASKRKAAPMPGQPRSSSAR